MKGGGWKVGDEGRRMEECVRSLSVRKLLSSGFDCGLRSKSHKVGVVMEEERSGRVIMW